MRWFIAGIIIGLLVLELKVLGGCGAMHPFQQKAANAPMPGAIAVAQAPAAKRNSCGCGATASVAPGQAKGVVSSPGSYGGQQLTSRPFLDSALTRGFGGPIPFSS
jgi:hypothetical protein